MCCKDFTLVGISKETSPTERNNRVEGLPTNARSFFDKKGWGVVMHVYRTVG